MNIVFLMDPLSTVIMEKDTSFIFMIAAHERGHKVFFLPEGGLTHVNGQTFFHVTQVIPQLNTDQPFEILEELTLNESDVHAVIIRTDPPFDEEYLYHTWILDRLPPSIAVINNPSGIRSANEKIWATQFTSVIPSTLVGRHPQDLMSFLKQEQKIVIKPTDGFGGKGISILEADNKDAEQIFKEQTADFKKDIILQSFIPESDQGDKRIILLNGEPLGAVLRVHSKDDFRNNFFAGGQPHATEITQRDLEIIETIKPKLLELGLYFVGIDVMGPYLVEINVTSPTGVQEINRLNNAQLHMDFIQFTENLVDQINSKDILKS